MPAIGRMPSSTIVIHLCVFKNTNVCLNKIPENRVIEILTFQCVKKRFCNCIVPVVALAAHALDKALFLQHLPKGLLQGATQVQPATIRENCRDPRDCIPF